MKLFTRGWYPHTCIFLWCVYMFILPEKFNKKYLIYALYHGWISPRHCCNWKRYVVKEEEGDIDVIGGGGRLEEKYWLSSSNWVSWRFHRIVQPISYAPDDTFSSHHSFIHLQIHIGSHTVCTRGECLKRGSLLPIVYMYFSQSLGGNKTDLGR